MAGGLIQIAAHGNEDLFLTDAPQITFFNMMYRRHTNFSNEELEHDFITKPDFGKRSSCILSGNADMISRMALKVYLPSFEQLHDRTKIAWVHHVGHAMIKSIEIEIGGKIIDRHYGEWMHIFSQLVTRNQNDKTIDKLVGNVPELTDFTYKKDSYILYIPLYFWFCRSYGLSIPLIALHYSEIRINVEFYNLNDLLLVSPSHSIKTVENIVNLNEGEYLIQKEDIYGIFSYFNLIDNKLYYLTQSKKKFSGSPSENNDFVINQYLIRGESSDFTIKPETKCESITINNNRYYETKLKNCLLVVNYIYLDTEERRDIVNTKQDYLIEQLYYTPDLTIENINIKEHLILDQPCKLLIWLTQLDYIKNNNDYFNYTDSHIRKTKWDNDYNPILDSQKYVKYADKEISQFTGNSLILNSTILFNSQKIMETRDTNYYEYVQPYQHCNNILPVGVNMYSFSLKPMEIQPSGTTNMSQIENIDLNLHMNFKALKDKIKFRAYGLSYNVWRISNGLHGKIFIR